MFSGGVAEYVYGREEREFGDLGAPLGRALRRRVDDGALPFPLLPAGECIRATALGASEYSVQLSGNTGWISDPDVLLPRRNLQVVKPVLDLGEEVSSAAVAEGIRRHLVAFDAEHSGDDVALALSWTGLPAYGRLHAFAVGRAGRPRRPDRRRSADLRDARRRRRHDPGPAAARRDRRRRTRCSSSTACSCATSTTSTSAGCGIRRGRCR